MHELRNPFLKFLGVTIDCWRENEVALRLKIEPDFVNRTGRVHGGVLCSLLDAGLGYAGLFTPPGATALHSVTLSLTTNFLDSGAGKNLIVKGKITRMGKRIYFSEAHAWVDESLLVATAMGAFKYVSSGRECR